MRLISVEQLSEHCAHARAWHLDRFRRRSRELAKRRRQERRVLRHLGITAVLAPLIIGAARGTGNAPLLALLVVLAVLVGVHTIRD